MKKITLLFSLFASTFAANSQQIARPLAISSAPNTILNTKVQGALAVSNEKTLLCTDTIRYTQTKEQLLNPVPAFSTFGLWQSDAEAITQTYILSGSTLSVKGIEFFGSNDAVNGTPSLTVRASIYSVNASYVPTTQLATGTVTLSSATANYYYVNFGVPINVSANYAVVIEPISVNGILNLYLNSPVPGQSYDELLARVKSSYYASSSGNYITIPALTEIGNYNFEPIVAPIVSYTINSTALASPDPVCVGNPVVFTGTATPASVLSNRMYNYNVFNTFFGVALSDSTYVWDMDNLSPYIWSSSTSYTYPAAGVYDATRYVLGGFWNSCVDFATDQVTVSALPSVTANATSTTICSGASTTLSEGGAVSFSWNNGIGAVTSPVVSPLTTTTYIVTGTNGAGCTNTAQITVNVTPSDDATFNYTSNTFCTSGTNETPTSITAGIFSSTPGLVFANNLTGEINVSGSAAGTYTITKTTGGICPDVSTQSITITTVPNASFSYAQTAFCSGETNPSPVFNLGASAGVFSSTAGLSFVNATTGVVNLASSVASSYTVTNTIAAAGSCPAASATFNVTINTSPTAATTGGGTLCGNGSTPIPVTVSLTGSGPWNIVYSDGTNTQTILNQTTSPLTINAATSGNYTVTSVSNANCTSAGMGSAMVVFNPNPTVTITPISDLCDNNSAVTLVASPVGGTFAGLGVTGDIFDPAQGSGIYPITYNYVDANNCSGSAATSITVNPSPTVTMDALTAMCIQDGPLTLSGGLPVGGSYSGTGISAGQFDPAVSGAGSQTITYTFQDANSCSSAATQSLMVNDCAGLTELVGTIITLAPNPVSDQLFITVDSVDGSEIVWNMVTEDGKIVIVSRPISIGTEIINVSKFAKGVYFLQFTSSNGTMIKKVMIH
jgi:hypothetical protein